MATREELEKIEKELMAKASEACRILTDVKNRRRKREEEVLSQVNQEFRDEEIKAQTAFNEANKAHKDALNQVVLCDAKTPYPEGTILCEWSGRTSRNVYACNCPIKLTGRKGVMQIFRPNDKLLKTHCFRVPVVGDAVVRVLKKDGTPGINAGKWDSNWIPEGV
jgi:hypothetical protein